MAHMLRALMLLVVVAVPASADTVKLTIRTDPAGATVYFSNSGYVNDALDHRGYAPVTLEYEFQKHFFRDGRCDRIHPVTVRWASGAEASIGPPVRLCGATGKNQQIVFVRPTDVPGRDLDVRFALELERIAATTRRAPTWGEALARVGESWQRYAEESRRLYALQQLRRPVTCNSYMEGSYVYTSCY